MTDNQPRVLLGISDNEGYSPSQIQTDITLADLLEHVQNAIADFGEDALVILSNGQRYGAGYGRLISYGDLFESADDAEEDN